MPCQVYRSEDGAEGEYCAMNKRKLQPRAQQLANLLHDESMDDGIEFILIVSDRNEGKVSNQVVTNVADSQLVTWRLRKAAEGFERGRATTSSRSTANAKVGL